MFKLLFLLLGLLFIANFILRGLKEILFSVLGRAAPKEEDDEIVRLEKEVASLRQAIEKMKRTHGDLAMRGLDDG